MIGLFNRMADAVGAGTMRSLSKVGGAGRFSGRILIAMPSAAGKFHLIVEQMMLMGVNTLPVVLLTSVFVGTISAWQAHYLFAGVIPATYIGTAVGKAVFTELGPVLTALVVTGRVGAKLAAELGTMRVTEQMDAMVTLSLDPYRYLLAPRIAAGAIMTPVLTIFSAFFAIISAQLICQLTMGLHPASFYYGLRLFFKVKDVEICLVKALAFGTIIALCGCYFGFTARGGAVGVGEATKRAVVAAMVLILVANLLVVKVLL
jgi:phospholipid/cholesterol/gamma-HCH transport system permease protein